MKDFSEEEIEPISGWEMVEESMINNKIRTKIPQNDEKKAVNTRILSSSSQPNHRRLVRNTSKDYFSTKLSTVLFKRDKEFLHQYLKRQSAFEPTQHSNFQDLTPKVKLNYETDIKTLINQKRQHRQSISRFVSQAKSHQLTSEFAPKCLPVPQGKKTQNKKRRFYTKAVTQGDQNQEITEKFRKTTKISQRLDKLCHRNQKIDDSNSNFYEIPRRGLKFPLFYRQLRLNQPCFRKKKEGSHASKNKTVDLKLSEQFTDESIFETKFFKV